MTGLDGTPTQQKLAELISLVGASAGPTPVVQAAEEALAAHLWLLERAAAPGGIPLTSAKWLKPAMLTEFMEVLPLAANWIHSATREIDVHLVYEFRYSLVDDRLLRNYKNSLRLTSAGKAGLADPDYLWAHLVERLVPTHNDFVGSAAAVILVYLATEQSRNLPQVVAGIMGEAGWRTEHGEAPTKDDVWPVYHEVVPRIGNVGPRQVAAYPKEPISQPAVAMIRDALFLADAPDV